jgi:hypothetical protein
MSKCLIQALWKCNECENDIKPYCKRQHPIRKIMKMCEIEMINEMKENNEIIMRNNENEVM